MVSDNNVILLSSLNYQGIDFNDNRQDVSRLTMVHIDLWFTISTMIRLFLINPMAETFQTISLDAGTWTSMDIPLANFSGVDLTGIRQIKFDNDIDGDGSPDETPTFYYDNIYFY